MDCGGARRGVGAAGGGAGLKDGGAGTAATRKLPLIEEAAGNFLDRGGDETRARFQNFCQANIAGFRIMQGSTCCGGGSAR